MEESYISVEGKRIDIKPRKYIEETEKIECMQILSRGRIATGDTKGIVKIYDINNMFCQVIIEAHKERVMGLCELNDDELMTTGRESRSIKRWRVQGNSCELIATMETKSMVPYINEIKRLSRNRIATLTFPFNMRFNIYIRSTTKIIIVELSNSNHEPKCMHVLSGVKATMVYNESKELLIINEHAKVRVYSMVTYQMITNIETDYMMNCIYSMYDIGNEKVLLKGITQDGFKFIVVNIITGRVEDQRELVYTEEERMINKYYDKDWVKKNDFIAFERLFGENILCCMVKGNFKVYNKAKSSLSDFTLSNEIGFDTDDEDMLYDNYKEFEDCSYYSPRDIIEARPLGENRMVFRKRRIIIISEISIAKV